jgi:hypothetical protein
MTIQNVKAGKLREQYCLNVPEISAFEGQGKP